MQHPAPAAGFFETVLLGPRRVERFDALVAGTDAVEAEVDFGDLICSHTGLVHGGVIGAVLIEVACRAFALIGKRTSDKRPEFLLRHFEVSYKSIVRSPSHPKARAELVDRTKINVQLFYEPDKPSAVASATFGLSSEAAVEFPKEDVAALDLLEPSKPRSPHVAQKVSVSMANSPESQGLLYPDEPQRHSWMYRTFFGANQLEFLEELHVGLRGTAEPDAVVTRWPDTVVSSVGFGPSCRIPGSTAIHPAALFCYVDHLLAHAHTESHASSAVTASQTMSFHVTESTEAPATCYGVAKAVSRTGRRGITEGKIALGGKVVCSGASVMIDRVPQPPIESRMKLYGMPSPYVMWKLCFCQQVHKAMIQHVGLLAESPWHSVECGEDAAHTWGIGAAGAYVCNFGGCRLRAHTLLLRALYAAHGLEIGADDLKLSCSWCHMLMDRSELMRCGRCKVAVYCSAECQTAHSRGHRETCDAYSRSGGITTKGILRIKRFFTFISLFTFFMLLMVIADNWLLHLTGWEGLGLVPHLLIAFWFT
ncbi:hypothetical protein DFJ74DRAFT_712373 [Hyaloraphidium curvatum]|nr:hypothetical protein DFJ74DRAFT_712373 [Hyaloraphidium curvatum]